MKRTSFAFAVLCAALAVSCSESPSAPTEPNPPVNPPVDPPVMATEVAFDQQAYQPFEAVVVTVPGTTSPDSVVAGFVGETEVTLRATSDSTLLLFAPAEQGTHELRFEISDETFKGDLVVLAGTVEDPVVYVDDVMDRATAALDSAIQVLADDLTFGAEAAQYAQVAADSLAAFQDRFHAMTSEEQAIAAAFLAEHLAGRPTLREILDIDDTTAVGFAVAADMPFAGYSMPSVWIPTECRGQSVLLMYQCTWGELGFGLARISGYLAGAYGAAKVLVPIVPPVGIGVSGVLGAFAIVEGAYALKVFGNLTLWHGLAAWELGAEAVDATKGYFRTTVRSSGGAPGLAMAAAPTAASSLALFTSDEPVTFTLEPQVRRVTANDTAYPFLAEALTAIRGINDVLDSFGAPLLEFAAPSTDYLDPVPASQVDVELVAGDVRIAQFDRNGEEITLAFATDSKDAVPFQYDLIYSGDGYAPVRIRHEAVMGDSIAIYSADVPGEWHYHFWINDQSMPGSYFSILVLEEGGSGTLVGENHGGVILERDFPYTWRIEYDGVGYLLHVMAWDGETLFRDYVDYPVTTTPHRVGFSVTRWAEKVR